MAAYRTLLPLTLLLVAFQVSMACDNCTKRGVLAASSRQAMLSAHGPLCEKESGVSPVEVLELEQGPPPSPTLAQRRHVYCVLRRCDMIAVDGRPLQNHHQAGTKCGTEDNDTPEDRAMKVFYCGCGESATSIDHSTPGDTSQTTVTDSPQQTLADTPQRTLTDTLQRTLTDTPQRTLADTPQPVTADTEQPASINGSQSELAADISSANTVSSRLNETNIISILSI